MTVRYRYGRLHHELATVRTVRLNSTRNKMVWFYVQPRNNMLWFNIIPVFRIRIHQVRSGSSIWFTPVSVPTFGMLRFRFILRLRLLFRIQTILSTVFRKNLYKILPFTVGSSIVSQNFRSWPFILIFKSFFYFCIPFYVGSWSRFRKGKKFRFVLQHCNKFFFSTALTTVRTIPYRTHGIVVQQSGSRVLYSSSTRVW